ncbi:MAG: hypothetical protein VKP72_04360, partial [bacterium]|nr:hypothetical protein [bacterium]
MDVRPSEMFIPAPTIGPTAGTSATGPAPDPAQENKAILPVDSRQLGGGGLASDYGLPGSGQVIDSLPVELVVTPATGDLLADVPGFIQSVASGSTGAAASSAPDNATATRPVNDVKAGDIQGVTSNLTGGPGIIEVSRAPIITPAAPTPAPAISDTARYGSAPLVSGYGNARVSGGEGLTGRGYVAGGASYGAQGYGGSGYGGSGYGGYGITGGSSASLPPSGGSVRPGTGGDPYASTGSPSGVSSSEAPGKVGKKKKKKKKNKTSKLQKSGGAKAPGSKKSGKLGTSKLPNTLTMLSNYMFGKVKPMTQEQMSALQGEFGKFKGKGLNTEPTKKVGPIGGTMLHKAYEALSAGDTKTAENYYKKAQETRSPVMLDLDGDGKLGTTGVSTAKNRIDGQVGKTVSFDIDGDGKKDQIEWMKGSDGMLVDDRDGGATAAMNGNGEID